MRSGWHDGMLSPGEIVESDSMQITEDTFGTLTENCCTAMLELEITPASENGVQVDDLIVASVRITGSQSWDESPLQVSLPSTLRVSCSIRKSMSWLRPKWPTALGEVANIIGGSVKGLNEGDSQLSLPEVHRVAGQDYDFERNHDRVDVHFVCQGQALIVRYVEQVPAETSA